MQNVTAQYKIRRAGPANTVEDWRLAAFKNLIIPRYNDTTEANISTNIGLDSCGAIIYARTSSKFFFRKCNPKRWEEGTSPLDPANTIQWSVIDSISTPVASPSQGDLYLVGTSPTGVFVTHANEIATYNGSTYTYQTAAIGDLLYNATNSQTLKWNGTTWIRITINGYVHILYKETILGHKYFNDTLSLNNKPIEIVTQGNAAVSLLYTRASGVTYPWLYIRGDAYGSKITMGANNPGSASDIFTIDAGYKVNLFTGTYRPLLLKSYDSLEIWANSNGVSNLNALSFKMGNAGIIGQASSAGKWRFNKYGVGSFTGTAAYALSVDASGNIIETVAGGGGSGVPAGANTQIQYNNSGAFGASSLLTFSAKKLSVDSVEISRGTNSLAGNLAIGGTITTYHNLQAITTGDYNTAIGTQVLTNTTTGNNNVAIGFQSMFQSNSSGNVAIGIYTLAQTSGTNNVAIGATAMQNLTSGEENVAIGSSAFTNAYGSSNNVVIGRYAFNQGTGSDNIIIGDRAMYYSGSTTSVIIGRQAAILGSGNSDVMIGWQSGYYAYGANNVFLGYRSGYGLTSGGYNTFIGNSAGAGISGNGITTGSYNTIIGAQVAYLSSTLSNNIIIADGQGNMRINGNSSGSIGMGTNTTIAASAKLELSSTTQGFLTARMTTTQRDAITSPATGLEIYNTTTNLPNFYNGTAWTALGGSAATPSFDDVTVVGNFANRDIVVNSNKIGRAGNNTYSAYGLLIGGGTSLNAFTGTNTNIAIGGNVMAALTSGNYNFGLGGNVLVALTTATGNTAVGAATSAKITDGNYNTSFGYATDKHKHGDYNTMIGTDVNGNYNGVDGDIMTSNVFIGYQSARQKHSGRNNTFLGAQTGYNSLYTDSSIFIGYSAGYDETVNNRLIVANKTTSPVIYGDLKTNQIQINAASTPALSASAQFEVISTTMGVLIPRMTTTQKNAIASPAEGLEVYDLTLHQKSYYNGTAWINY